MRNYFTLDGVDSRDYGVYISGQGTFNAPSRDVDLLEVPGRNGDLVGLPTRLNNVELTYPAFIYTNFKAQIAAFRAFLLSVPGYRKLIDTYNPNEYRRVVYQNQLSVNATSKNDAGRFDITFNAAPQRYLISGDTPVTFEESGTITNPTKFPASPLLIVYGSGNFAINGVQMQLTEGAETEIDCESGYAREGNTSANEFLYVDGLDLPKLSPGENEIVIDNGVPGSSISQIDVIPRWWTV